MALTNHNYKHQEIRSRFVFPYASYEYKD